MKDLRRNEFIDMLEMAELLYEAKDKFIKCDIPTLGGVTYYPKADKLQINLTNKWEEEGFQFVKNILLECTIENPIQQATSLVKLKEVKRDTELRDEFAGLAMNGLISNPNIKRPTIEIESEMLEFSKVAYAYADAMMKQRKL